MNRQYRLPLPILDPEIKVLASREIRKQKIDAPRLPEKKLRQLAKACREIREKGLPRRLVLKKLPNGLGMGIFLHPSAKPIKKGEIIGAYSGKASILPQNIFDTSSYAFAPILDIRLSRKEQALFDRKRPFHPNRLYALDVDAKNCGNFTRYINHSGKPNLVSYLFKIPPNSYGLPPSPVQVIYMAHTTILPGEQLLISYEGDGETYWKYMDIVPARITPKTFKLDKALRIIDKFPKMSHANL